MHPLRGLASETPTHHKQRVEREFMASNADECLAVFAGVGFHPAFRYEKYRTEFARRARRGEKGKQGLVTLDETPIGVFMELEGPAEWIDRTRERTRLFAQRLHHDELRAVYGNRWRGRACNPAGKQHGFQSYRVWKLDPSLSLALVLAVMRGIGLEPGWSAGRSQKSM